jgi:hypothetical protein
MAVAAMLVSSVLAAKSAGVTKTYTFDSSQSTVVEAFLTSETYNVSGGFQLTYNGNSGIFDWVDAILVEHGDPDIRELGGLFYMDELVGEVVSATKIEFALPAGHALRESYDIEIVVTLGTGLVSMTGHRNCLMLGEPGYTLEAVAVEAAAGKMFYVDVDAPAGGDGSSWAAAFKYLQDALFNASAGTEIRVAQGIYKPHLNSYTLAPPSRGNTFQLINGVTIEGGYAGYGEADPDARDTVNFESILSGDMSGNDVVVDEPEALLTEPTRADNSYNVVASGGADSTAVLDGFTITGGNFDLDCVWAPGCGGGGMLNSESSPTVSNCFFTGNAAVSGGAMHNCRDSNPDLIDCRFSANYAGAGGGMKNFNSSPVLRNCTFSGNSAYNGGGMNNSDSSNPTLTNSTFSNNSATGRGGGMCNSSNPVLKGCTFRGNTSEDGGGMYNQNNEPVVENCTFTGNSASQGGGMYNNMYLDGSLTVIGCTFVGNMATGGHSSRGDGGGMYNYCGNQTLINCLFRENTAADSGSGLYNIWCTTTMINCTLSGSESDSPAGMFIDEAHTYPTNCIFWDVHGGIADYDGFEIITYFVNAAEGDYHLQEESPCINAGDNSAVPASITTDLDGNPRIVNSVVDMGVYEWDGRLMWHVDVAGGNDLNNGLSHGTAFATIQKGIDTADDGDAVLVWPGTYLERISFDGKAITVKGAAHAAVIETPGQDAVTFHAADGPNSLLENFVIRQSAIAIACNNFSTPTIRSITIVDNDFGITAYEDSAPNIINCIFWNNRDGDLFGCEARYSCVESGDEGEGNISVDPLFADSENSDYHLLSEKGRYVPAYGLWSFDEQTSPCVDGGDPRDNPSGERMPNGGRINMGAYGGTAYASMSEWPMAGDHNRNGRVDFGDFVIFCDEWLMELEWAGGR